MLPLLYLRDGSLIIQYAIILRLGGSMVMTNHGYANLAGQIVTPDAKKPGPIIKELK